MLTYVNQGDYVQVIIKLKMENILCYIVTDMTLRKSLFSNLNINSDYCDTNHVHVDKTLDSFESVSYNFSIDLL
jgi:hypothetical protein